MPEAIAEAETVTKSRTTKETTASSAGFPFPQFEMPKVEIPEAAHDLATKWVDQGEENFEKMIAATEELNGVFNKTCSTAAKGATDYAAKVTEVMHANTAAAFHFAHDIVAAKSLPEIMEISTANARKQLDLLASQNQELWSLTQKIVTETIKPIAGGMPKVFNAPASA
jgi:phasin